MYNLSYQLYPYIRIFKEASKHCFLLERMYIKDTPININSSFFYTLMDSKELFDSTCDILKERINFFERES